jgi:hypothetical protein
MKRLAFPLAILMASAAVAAENRGAEPMAVAVTLQPKSIHEECARLSKYQMYEISRTKTVPASSAWITGPIGRSADRMAMEEDRTCIQLLRYWYSATNATESPTPRPPAHA